MKKLFMTIISLFALFIFTNISFAQQRGSQDHMNQRQSHNNQDHDPIYKGHPNSHNDYHTYSGHQSRSYYGPKYPHYKYNGHWNTWHNWNYYCSRHPEYHRHGYYLRYHGELFFFFNDGITAFSFSIGG